MRAIRLIHTKAPANDNRNPAYRLALLVVAIAQASILNMLED